MTAFVSMRPDTFFESKVSGSIKAYQPRVFTIAPPRIDHVIAKRLQFALDEFSATGRLSTFPSGLSLTSETLTTYIQVLKESFAENRDLMEFVDNMSGGNVRQALAFLRAFVGSGHVDTQKILERKQQTGSYKIPLHEFVRAVIYGDHEFFDPAASPFVNAFDVS